MNVDVASVLATLPTDIERHELKYVVPFSMIDEISAFVEPYCAFDAHTQGYADRFYPVNSLYFDTPSYQFLKQRMWGADSRFNMRLRAYGDGTVGPFFAEVKYKSPTSVRKFRANVDASDWPHNVLPLNNDMHSNYLCNTGMGKAATFAEDGARKLFQRLASAYNIEPKIFTCYRRRAFVSTIDDYARVTFDIDMRYRPQDPLGSPAPYSLSPGRDCINYDLQTIYEGESHQPGNVILELKSTIGLVPLWMIELVRRFELKQVGFSKYMNSSLVQFENAAGYMEKDRLSAC